MRYIAYTKNNTVILEILLSSQVPVDFEYIIIENFPTDPIESWYIEDGEIKIDQQKLIELNRSKMPTLSPIEFDMVLDKYGLYNDVQSLISTNRSLSIAYNRATFFSRTASFVDQARISLGLTDDQVDAMWEQQ